MKLSWEGDPERIVSTKVEKKEDQRAHEVGPVFFWLRHV
jgi:hypothetical protein